MDWYNAIFFGPFLVGALLLVLSSIHIGGHHGHGQSHGQAHTHQPVVQHGQSTSAPHHPSGGHVHSASSAPGHHGTVKLMNQPQNVGIWRTALSTLFGTGKAPLLLVFELFLLAYGVIGLFANGILSHTSTELMGTVALSFTIALILGAGVARLSAAVLSKVLPDDESAAVSRLSLFGLTGTVAYPVTCTGGRIHVYDEFGTLHDEQCYIAENGSSITKGARARIVDILTDGKLIVEETVG